MKFLSLLPALILTFALAACGQTPSADQQGGVAVVDMNTLQTQSKIIFEATQHLEAIKQALLTEALATEQAYKDDPTPENDQIRQQAVATLQEEFGQAQQSLFTELRDRMDAVLEAYRVEHGLSLVVLKDTVLAMDPAMDATKDILAAFDAVELDLNALAPIKEVEAVAEPETPAAEDLPAEAAEVAAEPEQTQEQAQEPEAAEAEPEAAAEPEAEATDGQQ